jgi:hypothetical protein
MRHLRQRCTGEYRPTPLVDAVPNAYLHEFTKFGWMRLVPTGRVENAAFANPENAASRQKWAISAVTD